MLVRSIKILLVIFGKGDRIMAIVPNIITSLRIIGAISLAFMPKFTVWFYTVYLLCGFTDVIDGFIARRFKCESQLGAKLDSIADLLFYSITVVRFLPLMLEKLNSYVWIALLSVVGIRLISYAVAAVKYHRFAAIHTYLNKFTGFIVFLLPVLINQTFFSAYCIAGSIVGGIASAEELLIHITQKSYNPQKKYIFMKTK